MGNFYCMLDDTDIINLRRSFDDIKNIKEMISNDKTDGTFTFDELYEQRAYLLAALCNMYPLSSWISEVDYNGNKIDDHFIAGINIDSSMNIKFYINTKYRRLFDNINDIPKAPYNGRTMNEMLRYMYDYMI